MSLVLMAALGALLAVGLRTTVERRNIESTEAFASTSIDFIVNFLWGTPRDDRGVTADEEARIDDWVERVMGTGRVAGMDAWAPDGVVSMSDEATIVGTHAALTTGVRAAFEGEIASTVVRSVESETTPRVRRLFRQHGELLIVDVPVRIGDSDDVLGVVSVYFPFAPVAGAIASDTRTVFVMLGVGLAVLYLGLFRVVLSASKRLRRQVSLNERLALHDDLTGLPNRALLQDRTEQALRAAGRTGSHVALMLLDLDRFKEINDTLGHHHGDQLLQEVGSRLQHLVRDADTVARLGGDEFVILLAAVGNEAEITAAGERTLEALRVPFVVDGVTLDVDSSIGIAVAPAHGNGFDELFQHADVAMYQAKESHAGLVVYAPELDGHSPARLAMLGELRRAIDAPDELVLHYQPKALVATQEIVGVEALVRWQHPVHGMVPPMEFIPMAERTGLIRPLTSKVIDMALAQVRRWSDEGIQTRVAVNISARTLLDTAFPDEVAGHLAAHGLAADRLELELTESSVMSDPARALGVMSALAELGVELSIDDFGTGYSSMSYLKRLPVSELKIDRAFVTGMADDVNDAAIVRSSVDLARSLSLRVVAEGVETAEVWERLRDIGCDTAQGYYLSRPLPAAELGPWLALRTGAATGSGAAAGSGTAD